MAKKKLALEDIKEEEIRQIVNDVLIRESAFLPIPVHGTLLHAISHNIWLFINSERLIGDDSE